MKRREFIAMAVAAALPLAARAQQRGGMRRIGVLVPFAGNDPETQARLAAFRQGSKSLDGRRAAISASTFALREPTQINIQRSRKNWSLCNPT